MRKLFAAALSFLVITMAVLAVPATSYAWNPFGGIDCTEEKAATSAVCTDQTTSTNNPLTGNNGTIMNIVNIVSFVAGVAAIIIIILAGLRFITSSGGTEDVVGARRTLIYAVVGLVVIVIARLLVGLIVSKL